VRGDRSSTRESKEVEPKKPARDPETAPAINGAATSDPVDLTIEALIELWPRIRADIKSLDRRTEALLMEIDPVDITANEIVLAAAYEFHRDKVNEDDRRAVVEQVIGRRIGQSVRVSCVLRSEFVPASVRESQRGAVAEPEPVETAPSVDIATGSENADEKMLGAVVRMFDGEIVED
jgi:hypothetical protein